MKMFRQNMYVPNYYNYGYRNNMSNMYNTAFYNNYIPYNYNQDNYNQNINENLSEDISENNINDENENKTEIYQNETVENSENMKDNDTKKNEDFTKNNKESKRDDKKDGFRFGPIGYNDGTLSIFGFSLALDDLIIIALIFFLFIESSCDYSLLIILGLMLFNISISSLNII